MKKLLPLFFILFFTPIACESDESLPKLDGRLLNTRWRTNAIAYEVSHAGAIGYDRNELSHKSLVAYDVFEFISDSEVACYVMKDNEIVERKGNAKYILNYPNLTIYKDGKAEEFVFKYDNTFVRKGTKGFCSYEKCTPDKQNVN